MKKLEIIVKPGKSSLVREAIEAVGYLGITVSQAEGHGTQKVMLRLRLGKLLVKQGEKTIHPRGLLQQRRIVGA